MHAFNPTKILYTPDALNEVGQAVLARYPEAATEQIKQHNRLPELADVGHFKVKSDVLVLGKLKTLHCRDNGRSADYIAPSLANGCTGGCTYCYVDRHKRVNPITLFTNTDEILETIDRHVHSLTWPKVSAQTDPYLLRLRHWLQLRCFGRCFHLFGDFNGNGVLSSAPSGQSQFCYQVC